jgi:hypothetical protein
MKDCVEKMDLMLFRNNEVENKRVVKLLLPKVIISLYFLIILEPTDTSRDRL